MVEQGKRNGSKHIIIVNTPPPGKERKGNHRRKESQFELKEGK